jgi:hypothetical protein
MKRLLLAIFAWADVVGAMKPGAFTLAMVCLVLGASWPVESRAQSDKPAAAQPAPAKRPPVRRPPAGQPPAVTDRVPAVTSVALPAANPNSGLGLAISQQCSAANDPTEFSLPGAKGDIKLDRCYRGRDQLGCEFKLLVGEAKSLLEDYKRIVDRNYPDIQDMRALCGTDAGTLAIDIEKAREFADRFKDLKTEYEARSGCARRVGQSLKDVTLADLTQAPNLLKSIMDNLDSDMKAVSDAEGQAAEFAEKMAASQRAMTTLQKVHRAVCAAAAPKKEQVSQ